MRIKIKSFNIHLTSWQPGVAPCMHGALSTQELELHAIQFWGGTAENKGQSGPCFQMAAPGPGVSGGTQLLYLQEKTQWAQAVYSVLFHSFHWLQSPSSFVNKSCEHGFYPKWKRFKQKLLTANTRVMKKRYNQKLWTLEKSFGQKLWTKRTLSVICFCTRTVNKSYE